MSIPKADGNEHDQTKPKVDSKWASHLQLCIAVSLPELFTRNHFLVPVRKWKAEVQILKNMNAFVEHYFLFELLGGCTFHEEHGEEMECHQHEDYHKSPFQCESCVQGVERCSWLVGIFKIIPAVQSTFSPQSFCPKPFSRFWPEKSFCHVEQVNLICWMNKVNFFLIPKVYCSHIQW